MHFKGLRKMWCHMIRPFMKCICSHKYHCVWEWAHLAGVQHVSDGSSAQVSGGDNVLLTAGVPSSHCFRRGQRDAFGHADELLWSGGLWRRIWTAEHLQNICFISRFHLLFFIPVDFISNNILLFHCNAVIVHQWECVSYSQLLFDVLYGGL